MTVLVDSWAWMEYVKGSPSGLKAKRYIEGEEEIIVCSINIAEVYRRLLQDMPRQADELIDFMLKTSFVIPLTVELALQAAKIKHEIKLGMADAIVLATAKFHGAKILTGDDDFKGKENVIYIGA